jgi:hypothetical protein
VNSYTDLPIDSDAYVIGAYNAAYEDRRKTGARGLNFSFRRSPILPTPGMIARVYDAADVDDVRAVIESGDALYAEIGASKVNPRATTTLSAPLIEGQRVQGTTVGTTVSGHEYVSQWEGVYVGLSSVDEDRDEPVQLFRDGHINGVGQSLFGIPVSDFEPCPDEESMVAPVATFSARLRPDGTMSDEDAARFADVLDAVEALRYDMAEDGATDPLPYLTVEGTAMYGTTPAETLAAYLEIGPSK